jgi:hypothetical protein
LNTPAGNPSDPTAAVPVADVEVADPETMPVEATTPEEQAAVAAADHDDAAHAPEGAVDEAAAFQEEADEEDAADEALLTDEELQSMLDDGEDLDSEVSLEGGRRLTVARLRRRAVRSAMLGLKHRSQIGYTQGPRRWEGINRRRRAHRGQFPFMADCSSFVTWCLWDALGGPNAGPDIVNRSGWHGGFTGTEMANGRRVQLDHARPGDLVFYGPAPGRHVAIVVAKGKVVSHGSAAGPFLLNPRYRNDLSQVRRYLG